MTLRAPDVEDVHSIATSNAPASTAPPSARGSRQLCRPGRHELVFHLHRLDDDERLTRRHDVAGLHQHAHDLAGHRRMHSLRPHAGARRLRPAAPCRGR
jgi:hypothetical protein